jgi:hypothetical protein
MKSSLHPTTIEDLKPLSEFLARTFDTALSASFLNPAAMAWKYWERRDDWSGPRSYVLRREGEILAHAGIWPMTFGAGANAVRGIHMIDWASAKESPGAGLSLVQKLAGMFDFIFSIGGSEMTCKVLPAFGFVECKRVWKGVRPLRPVRQILTHQNRNWKLAPRLLRNSWWACSVAPGSYKNWSATEILPQQLSKEAHLSEAANTTSSPRSPAFFEYLLRCPLTQFHLYRIVDGQDQKGHFAINILRGQARVAGVWLREPATEAWAAAYFLAQRVARRLKTANEIVAVGSEDTPSQPGATRAGFRIAQGPTVYLLDKTKKLPLSRDFQFQLCESDAAFLDSGAASYWS